MLVLTGVMLGAVLLVMVGEQVQEMQQAGWCSTTTLTMPIPAWMGMWFAVFPNAEGLAAQFVAGAFVIGSTVPPQPVPVTFGCVGKNTAPTRRLPATGCTAAASASRATCHLGPETPASAAKACAMLSD